MDYDVSKLPVDEMLSCLTDELHETYLNSIEDLKELIEYLQRCVPKK